jgi:hypothetical protein
MTSTYDEALNILPTVLFNIVNQYYYGSNMYPFLEEIKNYSVYDLNTTNPTLDDFDEYDWKKNNDLSRKYIRLFNRYEEYKNLTDIQKEIFFLEINSYNNQLYEFHLYGNNLLDLTFIRCNDINNEMFITAENNGYDVIDFF